MASLPTEINKNSTTTGMTQRLRLLHVGPVPPPWSGMGVFLENFIASAPINFHANWVLNTSRGALPGDPRKQKLPTPLRIIRHINLAGKVAKTIQEKKIHVIHFSGSSHDLSFISNGLAIMGARFAGARAVWHLHEDLSVALFPGGKSISKRIFAVSAKAADRIAVLTDKDMRIASTLVPPHKIAVIPPTCSPEFLTLNSERRNSEINVLYVGWLTQAKGIYDLLDVANAVRRNRPEICFHIIGTGMSDSETNSVRSCAEKLKLNQQIKFYGVLTGDAKRKMFAQANVLFLPTHWDAFPVVVLEAMAAGLPVLATNTGGLPYMLEDGRGAILTEVGAIKQMSDCLTELSRNQSLRLQMGKVNREKYLACYHPDKVGGVAVNLYKEIVLSAFESTKE
jgi:glycosyltransferase involved in cell wall biosynthesis